MPPWPFPRGKCLRLLELIRSRGVAVVFQFLIGRFQGIEPLWRSRNRGGSGEVPSQAFRSFFKSPVIREVRYGFSALLRLQPNLAL
jgi:hypothetical protein